MKKHQIIIIITLQINSLFIVKKKRVRIHLCKQFEQVQSKEWFQILNRMFSQFVVVLRSNKWAQKEQERILFIKMDLFKMEVLLHQMNNSNLTRITIIKIYWFKLSKYKYQSIAYSKFRTSYCNSSNSNNNYCSSNNNNSSSSSNSNHNKMSNSQIEYLREISIINMIHLSSLQRIKWAITIWTTTITMIWWAPTATTIECNFLSIIITTWIHCSSNSNSNLHIQLEKNKSCIRYNYE